MKKCFPLLLVLLLFVSYNEMTQKMESQLDALDRQSNRLDSLVDKNMEKLGDLDSLEDKEIKRIPPDIDIDSFISSESGRIKKVDSIKQSATSKVGTLSKNLIF